jgi:hypothetical protein
MEIKIDRTKLAPETVTALIRFSKTAARYHSGKFHKKEYVSVGNERFLQERVIPRSVETDYLDARRGLLECQDMEIRGILEQLDVIKLLDSLEGTSPQAHTDAHYQMIGLEKDLVQFITKNLNRRSK